MNVLDNMVRTLALGTLRGAIAIGTGLAYLQLLIVAAFVVGVPALLIWLIA